MDLENMKLSEMSRTQKDKYCVICLLQDTRMVRFIETESRIEVTGAGGWGREEASSECLMGTEAQFGKI